MNEIWKYQLDETGVMEMPEGAQVLSAQMQHDWPVVWAKVDPRAPIKTKRLGVYGTGHAMPDDPGRFIGTFQMDNGALVFHVFDPST